MLPEQVDAIIANKQINPSVKIVWLALLKRVEPHFTYDEIADLYGISRDTVGRACDVLNSLNLFRVTTQRGRRNQIVSVAENMPIGR